MLMWMMLACQGGEAVLDSDSGEPTTFDAVQVSGISSTLDEDYQTLLIVSWEQLAPATVWVEYEVDPGEWRTTPAQDVGAGEMSQVLLGIPYEHSVTFRVANDFGQGAVYSESFEDNTHLIPDDLPLPTTVEGDAAGWDPEMNYVFMSLGKDGGRYHTFVIDRQGRVVWARKNPANTVSLHPRISHDGTQLLVDESTFWSLFDGGEASVVRRMYIDGTVVDAVSTPGLHHPFTDLPDGSLAWAAMDGLDEIIYHLDTDGTLNEVFRCQEYIRSKGSQRYCGSNTLWYDASTDHFLYSLYSIETMIEVDRSTGEVVRHFGHLDGGWSFSPEESIFWWQHGGYYTEAGTLLVSSRGEDNDTETVIREYALREDTQTLEEIWSFGEGEGIYGDVMGEAHRLPGGNTLHNMGSAVQLREVTPDGQVVWDIVWEEQTMGRSTPVEDLYDLLPQSSGSR